MLAELAGFTLSRTIPDKALMGVLTGAYEVCGGVIRNQSGQIVAHLMSGAGGALNPAGLAVNAINSVQLVRIGKSVGELQESVGALQAATSQVVALAQGTMALSGLTLAVSAANFVFLSRKLASIDQKLNEIAKDVKAIKAFLQSQEKAALTSALKTVAGIGPDLEDKTRIQLLVNARQTLGQIHERYRDQLVSVDRIEDVFAVEEYYSATALAFALCSAELDMHGNAVTDLRDSYSTWQTAAQRVCTKLVFKDEPQRFLAAAYAPLVKTEELVDWIDFAHGTDKGIEWMDTLREKFSGFSLPHRKASATEQHGVEVMRKLAARNRIYRGYLLQYEHLERHRIRPSALQSYIEALDPAERVDNCFVFVASGDHRSGEPAAKAAVSAGA